MTRSSSNRLAALTSVLIYVLALSGSAQELQPSGLTAKPLENSLGLRLNEFTLKWKLPDERTEQYAYQILVASDRNKLDADVGDLWDSGWRYSDWHAHVFYQGKPLPSGAQLFWKVRMQTPDGVTGEFSDAASFRIPDLPARKEVQDSSARRHRIAFLGSTLISRMEKYGYLEAALTARWPNHDITFRNLGWSADDVFGTARSEFGSAFNTQSWKPPESEDGFGFAKLLAQIEDSQPTTLIVGYGAEAAFATDYATYQRFQDGYQKLISELEKRVEKIIVLSPTRHEAMDAPLPNPAEQNRRLRQTAAWLRDLANERGYGFVDLFNELKPKMEGERLTDNGIHLNETGYQRMTEVVLRSLDLVAEPFMVEFSEDGEVAQTLSARIDGYTRTERGFRFDLKADTLPTPAWRPAAIQAVGANALKIDGDVHVEAGSAEWANGVAIQQSPDHAQVDRLRRLIVKKNEILRWRLQPMNEAYIFLFRQHEMGHLAYEMEDLLRLAEEKEELIARLRKPRAHRYEVEEREEWKPPREYPDHEVPQQIPEPDIEEELTAFTIADGFEINLFASNPDIANPINLNWDARGRAWVSTSSTYPHIKPGRHPNDRIVILEDADQDGRADKSTVFAEGLLVPHSVMPVPGGAYVCSSTEVLFLADHDDDDRADSRRVVYSGFGNADVHHMIHGLRWSPWGDLFFTQSIYINSFVETPWGYRRLNGSGIWQFRPESEQLQVFCRGMINPWGHAFDRWGQSFCTDGAGSEQPIYAFSGAAFQSAVRADRILPGLIQGKPKNTAAEIVTGRHMPDRWHGSLLANDFRANRTIRYELTENGSGYSAVEAETVLHSSHRSFRPVDIKMGPEGAIYIVDWYNPIIDHGEVDFHHPSRDRSHGRIWRLTAAGRPTVPRPRIHGADVDELVKMLNAPEQWTRMQANRELANRRTTEVLDALSRALQSLDPTDPNAEHFRVEALWLHGAINAPNTELLQRVLSSSDHRARAAAVRMVSHWADELHEPLTLLSKAVEDDHPQVRLESVNALRQIGTLESANLALRALYYPVDENLDYALWLTAVETQDRWLPALQSGEQVFDGKIERIAFALGASSDSRAIAPLMQLLYNGTVEGEDRRHAVRLIAGLGDPAQLDEMLEFASQELDLLPAIAEGAASNRSLPQDPSSVVQFLTNENVSIRAAAAELAGRWRVADALPELTRIAGASSSNQPDAVSAAQALARLGDYEVLEELASDDQLSVRLRAVSAWASAAPEDAAQHAIRILREVDSTEDTEALIKAFLMRQEGPEALANAFGEQRLPAEIAAAGIRVAFGSGRDLPKLVSVLSAAGQLQPVTSSLPADQRRQLLAEVRERGDAARGEQIFLRKDLACAKCHLVDGVGGKLGPDLTTVGSYMTDESLLESLINPSAAIKQGYETVVLLRSSGVIVTGTLQRRTDSAVLIRDQDGQVISIPNDDIDEMSSSPVSLMPQGLTAQLRRDELIDLLRFLTTRDLPDAAVPTSRLNNE